MPIQEENREIIEEFVAESVDNILEVEAILVEMEGGGCEADLETLNLIFRAFHSIKGTAGFLELENVVRLTHLAESLLDLLRTGALALEPLHVATFLQGLACLSQSFAEIRAEGTDLGIEKMARSIGSELETLIEAAPSKGCAVEAHEDSPEDQELLDEFVLDALEILEKVQASLAGLGESALGERQAEAAVRGLERLASNGRFLDLQDLATLCQETASAIAGSGAGSTVAPSAVQSALAALRTAAVDIGNSGSGRVTELPELLEALAVRQTPARPMEPATAQPAEPAGATLVGANTSEALQTARGTEIRSSPSHTIRVDTLKLDELMNLVGELIIAENMVTHNEDLEGHEFENFQRAAIHLNRITRGLQDLTMSVRMVPIRPTFRKMLRVARDVARKQHKDVDLILSGEGTEVDRSIVEAIGDPLLHLLRNAVDHGIEEPELREGLGKPRRGQLRLGARHEGGEVWIELRDDGKGLDRQAILKKAIEKGAVESGEGLSEQEIYQLICEPGFSTAEALSEISGRGVGMDVVRKNIEKLRGRLEISSVLGRGSTFTIRIPLTLAIVEGMQVRVGEHSYTIPLFAIRESVTVDQAAVSSLANGDEVLELRGQFIPVIRLTALHSIDGESEGFEDGVLVIVHDGGITMALFVDRVVGQRQTVVKPLPDYLGALPGLAGCSILSTGKISLVLDIQTLTMRARSAG